MPQSVTKQLHYKIMQKHLHAKTNGKTDNKTVLINHSTVVTSGVKSTTNIVKVTHQQMTDILPSS